MSATLSRGGGMTGEPSTRLAACPAQFSWISNSGDSAFVRHTELVPERWWTVGFNEPSSCLVTYRLERPAPRAEGSPRDRLIGT